MTQLRRPGEALTGVLEVVDVVLGELRSSARRTSANRCARSTRPCAHACARSRVHLDDLFDRLDNLGPARRVVGRRAPRAWRTWAPTRAFDTLPPTQIEIPSVSALLIFTPGRRCSSCRSTCTALRRSRSTAAIDRGRTDRAGRARGDQGRNLAHLRQVFVVDDRRAGVHAEDGDVRAVDRAAHVEAAGVGHAQLGGQILSEK